MELLIGAHMSISGGFNKAFQASADIGGNSFQIFAKAPKGRNIAMSKLKKTDFLYYKAGLSQSHQKRGVIHSIYLVNLGRPFKATNNDRLSLIDDIQVADNLSIQAVNIHIGKYGEFSKQQAIQNMVENVSDVLQKTKNSKVKFVFENTAGQGTEIGWNFQELGELYDNLKNSLDKDSIDRLGFCYDTAHGYGAGYDPAKWDEVVAEFDKYIGIDKLTFLHLNDSKAMLGSKLDRHASLGQGFIGLPALANVIKWAYKNQKPIIIETPEFDIWPKEIDMIKKICSGEYDNKWIQEFHKNNYKKQYIKKFESYAQSQSLF